MAEEYLTDDEQAEAVKRAFREYAPWILGGIVLGVGGWWAFQHYQSHKNEVALRAADRFSQMAGALQSEDANKSRQIAEALVKDFPDSPYADQARLTIARMEVENGKPAGAVPRLTEVMNNSKDSELRQIARLRLARVLIDQGKPDDAIQILAAGTPGSFAGRYHEIHGDALNAKKDVAGALVEYKAALGASDGGADAAILQLKIADLAPNEKAKT